MDTQQLFNACRLGDFQKLQYLIEQREVEVNVRDRWDSTPLYYACLCGHKELVEYLLNNGARCEVNTFDGERCVYGALNDTIRNMLRSYKVVTSHIIRRDAYGEFLRKLFESNRFKDVEFKVHNRTYLAHRCVLIARSSFFQKKLNSVWYKKRIISITNEKVNPDAFYHLLYYLYTGTAEFSVEIYDDLMLLARKCLLEDFSLRLKKSMENIKSFNALKPNLNVQIMSIQPNDELLRLDFGFLAKHALPHELCALVNQEMPFAEERNLVLPDVCFVVKDKCFLCHMAFVCGRCEYFETVIDNTVDPIEWTTIEGYEVRKITLKDISIEIFIDLLNYIYQDSCDINSDQEACDVLYVAEMYLLPGLKRICSSYLERHLNFDNVFVCLQLSRIYKLPRLEDKCAEFFADNLFKIINSEELANIITEDAHRVKAREDTDSIDIIDQIRFHITSFMQAFSEIADAREKLLAIDELLEDLGYDC